MRIMFDTNAFDKMCSSNGDVEKIIASDQYEYFITSVQIEEIGNIPDTNKEQRIQDLLMLCQIRAQLLFTPAAVDSGRVGYCVVGGEEDVYSELLNETRSNKNDAVIGSTAKREQCTVVTDDKDFKKRLKKNGIPILSYDEFIRSLSSI